MTNIQLHAIKSHNTFLANEIIRIVSVGDCADMQEKAIADKVVAIKRFIISSLFFEIYFYSHIFVVFEWASGIYSCYVEFDPVIDCGSFEYVNVGTNLNIE